MKLVSFVIPCYRSAHTIGLVVDEIRRTMPALPDYDYVDSWTDDYLIYKTLGKKQ